MLKPANSAGTPWDESGILAVYLVIHPYRNKNGKEITRIISARMAEKHGISSAKVSAKVKVIFTRINGILANLMDLETRR
jgi:hypothetical protein